MVVFESIEDIFQSLRNFNDYSRALVTLATAVGAILIILCKFKIVLLIFKDLRLYVCSQLCCKTNFREKYGQWAVVSGSTDGIGLAIAKELAQKGMSIIVIGRNEEKLSNTKLSLMEEPNVGEVLTIKIDLSDSSLENYERIRTQIDPDNRDIGVLVNNAGIFSDKFTRFYHFDMKFLQDIVNVNILATLYLTRMILPGMVGRQKGLIANVSSILGYIPGPYMGVYAQTKAFINSFSESLQIEYAQHPIDIINLTPGPVKTKLFINTSKLTRSGPMIPTPEDYARTSMNALSAGYRSFCGTYAHEISLRGFEVFNYFGLIPILTRINIRLNAKNGDISPVMKRKRVVQTSD